MAIEVGNVESVCRYFNAEGNCKAFIVLLVNK